MKTIINRSLYPDLINHLDKKEISVIVGPRQAGKTTLMMEIEKYIKEKGGNCLFYNLDVERFSSYFLSQESLLSKIQLEFGKSKGVVFIDEIQRKSNAGLFLKGLYDMNLPYKFIVSDSGSLELKENIYGMLKKHLF